jgi:heme-degrading monooxygenase HmoA
MPNFKSSLKSGGIEYLLAGNSNNIRYARRVALKVNPDKVDNFLSKMRSEIFPNLRNQEGIRRMYLLRTPGTNDFVSLTFWNNKSYADSYGASDYMKNTESLRDLLESDPTLTEFDVDLHDVNAEDLPAPKSAVSKITSARARKSGRKSKTKKSGKKKKSRRRK